MKAQLESITKEPQQMAYQETHDERVAQALEIISREAGPLAGELVFEFMRLVTWEGFRWSTYQPNPHLSELEQLIQTLPWSCTPQGSEYWAQMFHTFPLKD